MNRPVQVTLDLEQRRRARRRAAELGLTLSDYVADLVKVDLATWAPGSRAPAGISVADATDVPGHEGTYIGEAVAARMRQSNPSG